MGGQEVGSGYGYGYGDGSGYGSGDGYGYGYGDGSGYGSGDGYGYGYGYGDGYGDGDGETENGYWASVVSSLASKHGVATQGGKLALWWSDAGGHPCNGGKGEKAEIGRTASIDDGIAMCKRGFHASHKPFKWNGARLWLVELSGEVQGDADKFVASRRTVLAEVTDIHPSFKK